MNRQRLRKLYSEIEYSRRLVQGIDTQSQLSGIDEFKFRGFIVLSHAALEKFFESWSYSLALEANSFLTKQRALSFCGVSLINYYKAQLATDFPFQSSAGYAYRSTRFSVNACINLHKQAIENNNGIRESNINRILVPLGVSAANFDSLLPIFLEGLADKRGPVAHGSGIQTVLTISDYESDLFNLIKIVERFHSASTKLCRKVVQTF